MLPHQVGVAQTRRARDKVSFHESPSWQIRTRRRGSQRRVCAEVVNALSINHAQAVWFEGNFKEYDADFRRRKGAEADTPHRVAYRKLVRS